jgi:hypothetical protein
MVVKKASLVLNSARLDHGGMTTTRLLSLGSLRALASSRRRGHLAGSSWLAADRDLDRVAGDLLAAAHVDPERLSPVGTRAPLAAPVDLGARRARGTASTPAAPSTQRHHAQAS